MKPKHLLLAVIVGVAITLVTGLIPNTPPMLVGAIHYGYPFPWLFKMIVGPEYFPWVTDTGNLVVDMILWSIIAGVVLFAFSRKR